MFVNKKPGTYKNRWKLLIAYKGSRYQGWQKQKYTKWTIQGRIEQALKKVFKKTINVYGAGRTDAGVHALEQSAHVDLPSSVHKTFPLRKALNAFLPEDIIIRDAATAPVDFHALRSAEKKSYTYLILNRDQPCVFRKNLVYWHPYKIKVNVLSDMAKIIKGSHDFNSFQTAGTQVKSTIRKIFSAFWERRQGDILAFCIEGSGFLKQMIRNLVGTQLELLKHQNPVERFKQIFSAKDRKQALKTAPAEGLYLCKVHYPKEFE